MNELTHLDLFSGIGGFSIGFERAGFKTIAFAEINEFCSFILQRHWPFIPNLGAVENITASSVSTPPFVITSGDPCQENSNARQGVDTISPSLGHEFVRVVALYRPRFVLRENPSAVRPDAPWPWQRIRSELESLGYIVLPVRLRSCCLGADHQRERLFLLGELPDPMRAGFQRNEQQIVARASRLESILNAPRQIGRLPSSKLCRKSDGIPGRMDRIKALGNSVDPKVAQIFAEALKLSVF